MSKEIKENYWHGWRPGWGGWRGRGWRGFAPRWSNYPLSYSYPVYQEVPVQVPTTSARLGDGAVVSPSSNNLSNMNPILLIIGLIILIIIIVKLMMK